MSEVTQQYISLKNPAVKAVNLDYESPDSTFEVNKKQLSTDLQKDEILVKVLYLSNDPTQRGWIQKGVNPKRSYVPPVFQGETMRSLGLCKIVKVGEDVKGYQPGDIASGIVYWADYLVIKQTNLFNKIENTSIPLTLYLDVIGMTGLTAYFGLKEVGQFKEGQTIIISAASGATGSTAVQLAKKVFKAKKVIAITGSDAKCEYVKSIGADVAVNYKTGNIFEKLNEIVGDDLVDCYFDLVGGEILDAALKLIKPFGRVIACGAISGYNDGELFKIQNYPLIITNRLTVQGFIVGDFRPQFPEAIKVLAENVTNGTIKTDSTTISLHDATKDFSKIPKIWNILFTEEKGNGKLLTKVSDP